ncbi:copper chaperone PCu(A)C [Vibrio sp. EA2]|uniref:copper chaperone PCu(A)C n=1 Tax=Vibrio sp. EA2 TaxID=3079860 RepID=UPI002949663A|nr:copper chaperone PCu(A)C [Vibrio sp. EA2]MDV6252012.1 copper chaperone PCu(A)C [Vibrio sp. EA2]
MKARQFIKALAMSALLLSPLAQAKLDVMAHEPYARAMAPGATTSAVFVTFANRSQEDIKIVSAETPAAGKVELHDVITEGDVMKMRQIDHITLNAKSTTELKPGSLHIMLFNLTQPLQEGDEITVTVTFDNGLKQSFNAPVKKVMAMMKHSAH